MLIQSRPDPLTQIIRLGDIAVHEPAGDAPQHEGRSKRYQSHSLEECITNLQTPRGPKPVLKTMVTTACERNCFYCPFRAGRGSMQRVTFKPDELAGAFDTLQRSKKVDGLFLSSGIIKGSVTTQDRLIDTVEIIRRRYRYRGYVHLKIMPGVERDQLYRAMQIADRISVNLEAPTEARLEALAPKKHFLAELLTMLQWAHELRQQHPHERLASTVTQFVVGAVGDTDLELMALSERLYRGLGLARAYYSSFHPIAETPFEDRPPSGDLREFRLYQSSFLLRDYGWDVEELPFRPDGLLRTDVDPKTAWADLHLRHAPVDLMQAPREQLLRVPGLGPKGVELVLKARRQGRLTELVHLRKIGLRGVERAAPYILLDGRRPQQQLPLF